MKRKSIAILLILSVILLQINLVFTNAHETVDLFDEILIATNSKTVEYGLRTSFKTKENPKAVCSYLINALQLNNEQTKLNILTNEDTYCIEFSDGGIKGYIEALKYNNEDVISINICEMDNKNGLVALKNKVSSCIGYRGENPKYFQYLKAKIEPRGINVPEKDIYNVNESIIGILKSHGSENIETVHINNGLSTIAYTKKYDVKINNNKWMDFNYAVCNYSSGSYIIIGTPEIITTY